MLQVTSSPSVIHLLLSLLLLIYYSCCSLPTYIVPSIIHLHNLFKNTVLRVYHYFFIPQPIIVLHNNLKLFEPLHCLLCPEITLPISYNRSQNKVLLVKNYQTLFIYDVNNKVTYTPRKKTR